MAPPKTSLPKGIKERIEENERKLLEGGDKGTPTPAPAAPAAPAPASPEPTIPVGSPLPGAQAATQAVVEPMIKPVTPEPPKPHVTATPEELLKRTSEALSTLQKRYNALESKQTEMEQANQGTEAIKAENSQLKTAISDLEKQVADLSSVAQVKPTEITKAVVTELDKKMADSWGVDPEEVAAYRQDIVDTVMKMIPKAPTPAPEPTKPTAQAPTITKPAEPAPSVVSADAGRYNEYVGMLDTLVGGQEVRKSIVNDPKFSEFLDMLDGGSKRLIRDIAEDADKARDAVMMAEVYRSFDQWKNAVTDPNKKPSHLMPASKPGPSDLNTNKKPIYSQAQVDEFHKKQKSGGFSTIGKNAEEAKKIAEDFKFWSDEFASARAEGRIRG